MLPLPPSLSLFALHSRFLSLSISLSPSFSSARFIQMKVCEPRLFPGLVYISELSDNAVVIENVSRGGKQSQNITRNMGNTDTNIYGWADFRGTNCLFLFIAGCNIVGSLHWVFFHFHCLYFSPIFDLSMSNYPWKHMITVQGTNTVKFIFIECNIWLISKLF